jgi:PAS domain S-box-containing protein
MAGRTPRVNEALTDDRISHAQFRALANSIPNLAWMAHPDGWIFWYNRRWYEYTGTTPEEMAGWGWQAVHHLDVLPTMLERWTWALNNGEPFEMTFPLRGADGVFRPFLTRVEPLRENGIIVGWYGTNTEVTEQERARERLQLMVNELNHRVKNTLATVQSIAMHTFRGGHGDAPHRFQQRLLALSSVHDVLTREAWSYARVHDIVDLTAQGFGADRFDVYGDEAMLSPQMASALAMMLHELATNAMKHGALSGVGGRVKIEWSLGDSSARPRMLSLRWSEVGGPPVTPPASKGFGLRLIERSLASERNAAVSVDFAATGVICTVDLPTTTDVIR